MPQRRAAERLQRPGNGPVPERGLRYVGTWPAGGLPSGAPAVAQLRQGEDLGELAAAVPHGLAIGVVVPGEAYGVPGDLVRLDGSLSESDEQPGRWEHGTGA
jgi:hypothetical protein